MKFTYQELDDGAFITAPIERNKFVYSVLLAKAKNPLSREEVQSHCEGELSKKEQSAFDGNGDPSCTSTRLQ
jgi:hypothetical protein